MMDSLESLLKQAELQKLQLQLHHQFAKNIALFEERFPQIGEKFKNHKPSNTLLRLDNQGNLNLFDQSKNMFFYQDSPEQFCEQQVGIFKKTPFINRLRIGKSPSYNDRHIHIRYINELLNEYTESSQQQLFTSEGVVPNLMITGLGIGYHLPRLINDLEVYNIFIYENNLDIFHACLHTIDWEPILDYFKQDYHSITFCLGVKPDRALIQVEKAISEIGLHNHIHTFIYKHTNMDEEQQFLSHYIAQIKNSASGLGYYDDEQIGLAHTVANLKSKHPIFKSNTNKRIKMPPAFIIGNGPSLDMHESFIRENKDNAVLFSCGTSFGSITKFGIKPDFHVEMERTISMKDILDFGTTPEDRKDVTLLCLNPVSPAVISSFDKACYGLKPNDIGESILQEYFNLDKLLQLPFSNPTVSNAALSFAISMGFSEIYLIGVDLGLTEQGQHHSTKSPHYDLEEHIEDIKEAIYTYSENNFQAKGNFGGQVKTHSTLTLARIAIERLLHYAHIATPNLKCYNSNNGAYIEGTQPIKLHDIRSFESIDKKSIFQHIEENNFHYYENKKYLKNKAPKILDVFLSIKEDIKLNPNIKNTHEFYLDAQRVYELAGKKNDQITHMLMRGTINIFLGLITEKSMYCQNNEVFLKQVKKGIEKYNALIDNIYKNMTNEPYRLDDTHNPTLHRINQGKDSNVDSAVNA